MSLNKSSNQKSHIRQIASAAVKYGVPLVITVGLCWLLFHNINFTEMIAIIRDQCNFWWIGLTLAISALSHMFRAMRWRIQLDALGIKAGIWQLTLTIFGTYAVNLVLPRLGEVWRTGYVSQRYKAPFTTVFGSMVADRLADTLTVLVLTLVTFILASSQLSGYLSQNSGSYDRIMDIATSPWLWGAIVICVLLTWGLLLKYRDTAPVRKLGAIGKNLWEGFAVIIRMPGKGRWLLLTLMVWGCYFLQLYVAFFSFPLTTEVVEKCGIIAVLVCFVLSSISMGVPSNGGIGPWQWAIMWGLKLYSDQVPGLTEEYTGSFANLVMGMQTLWLIVLGIFTFIVITLQRNKPRLEPSQDTII